MNYIGERHQKIKFSLFGLLKKRNSQKPSQNFNCHQCVCVLISYFEYGSSFMLFKVK